jgi:hypothetical protein
MYLDPTVSLACGGEVQAKRTVRRRLIIKNQQEWYHSFHQNSAQTQPFQTSNTSMESAFQGLSIDASFVKNVTVSTK